LREYPNGVLLLGRLALFAVLAAPVLIFGWYTYGRTGVLIALVFSAPILGKLITKPLIELTHEGFILWARREVVQPWERRTGREKRRFEAKR
jgi:hypothetical protein